jgi:SAM-dependent methyltransferase
MRPSPPGTWNHNTHYHRLLLGAVPPGSGHALDVGCGEGLLARQLRQLVPRVTAIDVDAAVIGRARQQDGGAGVEYVQADFLTQDFPPASFDVIVSVAALHHMDEEAALRRMRLLLRPGGTLAVVGLARHRYPADLPMDLAAQPAHWLLRARYGYREVTAPTIWPPPHSYAQLRRISHQVLPGAAYRRRLLWRYSVVWTKPPAGPAGEPGRASR